MSDVLKLVMLAMNIFEGNCMLPNFEIFETDKYAMLKGLNLT